MPALTVMTQPPSVNILLADDDPANLLALEAMLQEPDYRLVQVRSGAEALGALLQAEFAVVLLDVLMPGLDGFETAKLIRSREQTRHLPIIFLTAFYGDDAAEKQAYALGAVDFLRKPFAPEILRAKVGVFVELFKKTALIQQQADVLRQQEALRASEARFRELADAMPQIVWTARPDGTIEYFNRKWFEYTGFTQQASLAAGGWKAALHPDDAERAEREWLDAVRAERPIETEYRFKDRRMGGYRWHLGRGVPSRDDAGRIVRWIGTATDIDDLKRTGEALQEAGRRKDEFLAMLAHELRNPLAPIRNGMEILRQRANDPQMVEQVREMIDRQARHMTQMVGDLLDVSRITRGKITLSRHRLDLARLVKLEAEDNRAAFDAAGLALAIDVPETPIWVTGDPTRLTQVLDNLLYNAVKFSPRGGRVTVRVAVVGGEARFSVQDTGIGIEPQFLPQIFDSFAQADRSLDRSRGGLGLGLALVKGLVGLHGGTVTAESGGTQLGSTFTVRLPLEGEPAALSARAAPAWKTPQGLRVLVVEDNRDAAESLRILLAFAGHNVTVATTGTEGLEAARRMHPDVIVSDIGLPGLDGYSLASTLRKEPATARTPMIAVTGYGSEEEQRRSREAGFDKHLTKPVDPEELMACIATASRGR